MKRIGLLLVSIVMLSMLSGCTTLKTDESNVHVVLDSDDDGVPDDEDYFPFDASEQNDSDNDGIGDNGDKFPMDPAASVDSDNDGCPDRWNYRKNQSDSVSSPLLELDEFPFDPDEWRDSDGDRIGDNSDVFPDNPGEWSDLDGDGVGDNSDINPTVDLSISLTLKKFKVTGRVDLLRWAQVYFDIRINGEREERVDNNGKHWKVWLDREKDVNHVFTYDVPDHIDERYTVIEVVMYDYDLIGKDDVIDISDKAGEKTLSLKFDNVRNMVSNSDDITEGGQGVLWYEISFPEEDIPPIEMYSRTYSWNFGNKDWKFSVDIPVETYNDYRNSDVDRMPQSVGEDAMASFVTSDDWAVQDVAGKLGALADSENFNHVSTVNFILRFVQNNTRYIQDNASMGQVEYWRFPVETLIERMGDCEDTSVLFASIMRALGYDTVLFFYIIEKGIGHLSVGIHLLGSHGEYVMYNARRYYYCETTTPGYDIGELPPDMTDKPDKIIPV